MRGIEMMHRTLVGTFVLALAAIVSQTSSVQAGSIVGSLPFFGLNVTENGSDLTTSTTITATEVATSGTGTGDYSPIGSLTSFGGPIVLDLSTKSLTTLSSTYGSFTESSVTIVSQSSGFLEVYVLGTFTPTSLLGTGLTASLSSLEISVNKNGASLSEALTLSTPPASVPEPASLVMSLTSVVAGGLFFGIARKFRKPARDA
jgi:hypothetical protein